MRDSDDCGQTMRTGSRVTAVLMLAASLAVLILPLYLFILQLRTEEAEFWRIILAWPTWLLAMPGVLAVTVVLFTLWHAISHRATLRSLRGWVIALIFLQLIAVFAYWALLLKPPHQAASG